MLMFLLKAVVALSACPVQAAPQAKDDSPCAVGVVKERPDTDSILNRTFVLGHTS